MIESLAKVIELVDSAEDLLASGHTDGEVRRRLGLSRDRNKRLLTVVRGRWAQQADRRSLGARRAQVGELIMRTYRAAMEREIPVTRQVAIGLSVIEHAKSPDIGSAVRALELLCRFEGLLEQPDTGGGMNLTVLQHIQQVLLGADGGAVGATTVERGDDDNR